jgi:hypothetical protein
LDPTSITVANNQSLRDQIKADVRSFVRNNLRQGLIIWQGHAGFLIHALSPTGHRLPFPPRGPVAGKPPHLMTPFHS